MEITDRFQFTARRVLTCAVVGALGVVAAAYVVVQRPAAYRAQATVFVGSVLGGNQNSFSIAPLLADFETTVVLPETLRLAAASVRLTPAELAAGLRASRDGEGTSLRLEFTGADADGAADAVRTVARVALERLAQQDVDRADERLVRNKQKIRDIESEVIRIQNETGIVDFDSYYSSLGQETFSLRSEMVTASAERKTELESLLEARRVEAERLSESRLRFNELRDEQSALRQQVLDAARSSQDAQDRLVLAREGDSIIPTGVEEVSRSNDIARSAAAAFVLMASVTAFVQFVLAERRREHRRARAAQTGTSAEVGTEPTRRPGGRSTTPFGPDATIAHTEELGEPVHLPF